MSAQQSLSLSPARTWLAAGVTAAVLGLAVAAGVLATSVASGPLIFVETLSARILVQEHRLYIEALRVMLEGRWKVIGRRFVKT